MRSTLADDGAGRQTYAHTHARKRINATCTGNGNPHFLLALYPFHQGQRDRVWELLGERNNTTQNKTHRENKMSAQERKQERLKVGIY